jgi:hypothetical protein
MILSLLIWSFEFDLPEEFVCWDTYDSCYGAETVSD